MKKENVLFITFGLMNNNLSTVSEDVKKHLLAVMFTSELYTFNDYMIRFFISKELIEYIDEFIE